MYLVINEKLKKKYKSRKLVEDLYHDKKDLDYTFYISLKRENMKKLNATKSQVGQLPKKRKTITELEREKQVQSILRIQNE